MEKSPKSSNVITRNKLQELPRQRTLENLLDELNISDVDREIMRLKYIKDMSWLQVADIMKMSLSAVTRRHTKILRKISKII